MSTGKEAPQGSDCAAASTLEPAASVAGGSAPASPHCTAETQLVPAMPSLGAETAIAGGPAVKHQDGQDILRVVWGRKQTEDLLEDLDADMFDAAFASMPAPAPDEAQDVFNGGGGRARVGPCI